MKLAKKIQPAIQLFFIIVFVLINQGLLEAQNDADYQDIKSANKAYTEENYQKAVDLYEKVLSKDLVAAELYYNLGNAYYRLGNYKSAILNYERAKLIEPDDENIQVNLEFAQRFVQDKIEQAPEFFIFKWLHAFVDLFSVNVWSMISIVGFILFLGMIIIFLFIKSLMLRKLSFYFGFFLIFISITGFYSANSQNKNLIRHNTAIVFSPSVTVKSSPNENGTDLFIIHEGLKVTITGQSEGWNEIKLSDGKIGWLPQESIKRI